MDIELIIRDLENNATAMEGCVSHTAKLAHAEAAPGLLRLAANTIRSIAIGKLGLTSREIEDMVWEAIHHHPDCESFGHQRSTRVARSVVAVLTSNAEIRELEIHEKAQNLTPQQAARLADLRASNLGAFAGL